MVDRSSFRRAINSRQPSHCSRLTASRDVSCSASDAIPDAFSNRNRRARAAEINASTGKGGCNAASSQYRIASSTRPGSSRRAHAAAARESNSRWDNVFPPFPVAVGFAVAVGVAVGVAVAVAVPAGFCPPAHPAAHSAAAATSPDFTASAAAAFRPSAMLARP